RVKQGKFREDLYYRLQGFLIHMTPLRDRGNDIILLARFFLKEFCSVNKMPEKTLENDAIQKLLNHGWPGNVRELKGTIERAVLLSENSQVSAEDIMFPAMG
ncbi:MAG: sigma-54-dependent Fis family transcriptional regulator, partial [Cyclobacteriaceae bacterium]